MTHGSGGGETAKEHMERLFETQEINGVDCDIRPVDDVEWGEPLNPGWFGIPDGNPKFRVCPAVISIDDFLRIQVETRNASSVSQFERGAYEETVEKAKESIEAGSPEEIPAPVLELDYDEYQVKAQEGRSRAVGAKRGGEDEMHIWVAARDYR